MMRRATIAAMVMATVAMVIAGAAPAQANTTQPVSSGPGSIAYFGTGASTSRVAEELNTRRVTAEAASAMGIRIITCYVNFTTRRYNTSSHSYFDWAGGVGCTAAMTLSGRAFLVESGHHYVQYGPYVGPRTRSSYSSGGRITVKGHPSVYIFHGVNLKLLPSQQDNTIVGVLPQPGTRLSGASHCHVTNWTPNGPIGAHCDLYSDRF